MIKYLSVAALIAVGATVAIAQTKGGTDVISERKAAMKSVAGANKALNDIVKGDVAFDAAKVSAAYKTLADALEKSKALYPDNSKTGDTAALPAIWEKKADFVSKLEKSAATARTNMTAVTDLASLKTNHAEFVKSCGACHRDYRAPPKK
jgi:cytochrome c556